MMEDADKKDLIRNGLIALTSTVPYVGGTLSFLLEINIFHQRQKNERMHI